MKTFFLYLFFIILLLLPLYPLFNQGMFVSDDGGWMIVRLSDFHQSLKDSQFPVRWAGRLNHVYGYSVFNFLYPGVFYFGEIIHLLGFNFTNSIKILFGLSLIFSGVFSYLWLKSHFSKLPSLTGSLIYVYLPYHLYDIYKRGSLGEALALMIIPFLFWNLDKKNLFLGSISLALLLLFHNTLAFLFLPIIMLYVFILNHQTVKYPKLNVILKKIKNLLILHLKNIHVQTLIFGFLLSCFFWLPALSDKKYTIFDSVSVSNWQEYFLTLKNFYLLGWSSIIIIIIALVILFILKYNPPPVTHNPLTIKLLILFLIFSLLSILLSSSFSSFFWQILPLPKLVQFPWRFLALTAFTVAFLSAFILDNLSKFTKTRYSASLLLHIVFKIFPSLFLFFLFFLGSFSIFKTITYQTYPDSYYSTNEDSTTVKNEYTPKWVLEKPEKRSEKVIDVIYGDGEAKVIEKKSNYLKIGIQSQNDLLINLNLHYFPGWIVKFDGKKIAYNPDNFSYNPKGIIRLGIPKETKIVELIWTETPLRLFSDVISLISLIGLTYFSYRLRRK